MRGEEHLFSWANTALAEIPPHARRRGPGRKYVRPVYGNTSACAEKRTRPEIRQTRLWKYLRMRGEESKAVTFSTAKPEIPPHARRRESRSGCLPFIHGNTSACAEKSVQYPYSVSVNRKYLRMRGEEDSLLLSFSENGEIPPHARRRGRRFVLPLCGAGNTSACAEKRFPCAILLCGFGKYLRMRGEEG